ncbi:MAG: mannose-1-phosphate guanylyltransferase [Acidobacteriota bacterium]
MFSVIMAGGSGTRFWPASRERLPKQFLRITSTSTMFEETLARVRRFSAADEIYAVVGRAHEQLVLASADPASGGLAANQVLVEPVARNTAACIGLAAIHIARQDPDQPMVVLPADHFVADVDGFVKTIQSAAEQALAGGIVTLGITPTRPETGYGYIRVMADDGGSSDGVTRHFRMERFVEKPDQITAISYVADGRHFWNSGIFVFTARTILSEIDAHLPALAAGLRTITAAIGQSEYEEVLARVYESVDPISIDYGIMERTRTTVSVLKCDFGWSDVGSWQALYELRASEYDGQGNLLLGDVQVINSRGNLVYSVSKRLVALLGVDDLMVIDTPDAILVARLKDSQRVKEFPVSLKESGREEA